MVLGHAEGHGLKQAKKAVRRLRLEFPQDAAAVGADLEKGRSSISSGAFEPKRRAVLSTVPAPDGIVARTPPTPSRHRLPCRPGSSPRR